MRRSHLFLLTVSSLSAASLLAFPKIPKAKPDTPPMLASPYALCPQPLEKADTETLLACAEPEFWHAFSDGRSKMRKNAEKLLSRVISLTEGKSLPQQKGRLHALRGYLRLAMGLENGQLLFLLNNNTEKDFEVAMKLDPTNETYITFVDTIYMAKPAAFGQWDKAERLARGAFAVLAKTPTNILSLSGTTIGFTLASGIPQQTIEAMDAWVCPSDEVAFCKDNTLHTPYARPGLSFHFAEAYARMGMREKTEEYLMQAQQSPGYEQWPYRHLVEKPLADMDSYMKYWAGYGDDKAAFNEVYANQNYGCVMCHGR